MNLDQMSYSRSRKLTDTEKKLQALKTQLYGKTYSLPTSTGKTTTSSSSSLPTFQFNRNIDQRENFYKPLLEKDNQDYFKKDLLKTLLLATVIVGIQTFLFIGLKKGLI